MHEEDEVAGTADGDDGALHADPSIEQHFDPSQYAAPDLSDDEQPAQDESAESGPIPVSFSHNPELLAPLYPGKNIVFNIGDRRGTYILDTVSSPLNPALLAVSGSNNVVKLYNRQNLSLTGQLQKHEASLVGLSFSSIDPNILWTCAQDKRVVLWDVRAQAPAQVFQLERAYMPSSFHVNCTDTLFAVGTELKGADAHLHVFDIRSPHPMIDFEDAHADDVTHIRFHPTDSNVFVSGSTDGLVNVFNVAGVAECDDHHDLITQTFNSESSVSRVGFFGPANEFIYCLTHTETLLLWQLMEVVEGDETSELISRYTSIRESMRGMGCPVDYLIDCQFCPATQRLYLAGGSFQGALTVMHVNLHEVEPVLSMFGGNQSTVRCIDWNLAIGDMVAGDESSHLCAWTTDATPQPASSVSGLAMKGGAALPKRIEAKRKAGRPY